jgi:hypothetical protein
MRLRTLLLGLVALASTGCYRVTVVTGAPPAPQTIDVPWQNSFVFGLVPPPIVNAAPTCAQGVAQVQTERSFLNGLVGALSFSLYTPLHVNVTCASGPVQR